MAATEIRLNKYGMKPEYRFGGFQIRETIEKTLEENGEVTINCLGVEYVGTAFADEAYGKLHTKYPNDHKMLLSKITFTNASNYLKEIFFKSFKDRAKAAAEEAQQEQ